MKLIIIGYGTVGKVTEYILRKHKVITYDINPESKANIIGGSTPKGDMYFICTHENVVADVIENIRKTDKTATIVIRSTILPNFCHLFREPNSHVMHLPAFHTETNTISDFIHRVPCFVIGECCPIHTELLKTILQYNDKSYIVTDPNTSALAKLVNNVRLALNVSFWNEINILTNKFDANINKVTEIVVSDSRHQKHGTKFFGSPWEGKCLPKDVDNLLDLISPHNGILLKSIRESNEMLKKDLIN